MPILFLYLKVLKLLYYKCVYAKELTYDILLQFSEKHHRSLIKVI